MVSGFGGRLRTESCARGHRDGVALDIEAVMDAGDTWSGGAVRGEVRLRGRCLVATSYPDRAQALVLAGGFAKMTRMAALLRPRR